MPAAKVSQRLVLKLSGESLAPVGQLGIDTQELKLIAGEISSACELGGQIAVVVGGGNIIRGARMAKDGVVHQSTADYMGMLGTVINGLALKEALEGIGRPARVMSRSMCPRWRSRLSVGGRSVTLKRGA